MNQAVKIFSISMFLAVMLLPAQISCVMGESVPEEAPGVASVDTPKVHIATSGTSSETFAFQADVSKIMDILIHSLYSNKEIFLRELVSNASDALDKIRFFSLTDPEKYGNPADMKLQIRIIADKESNTLTIIDSGVGMTKEQLVNELGTVARSGTSSFIEAFEKNADVSLIGQFGVGFYSVYLIADTVSVTSKHPDSEKTWVWESSADQTFTIAEAETERERGSTIVLHLKEDASEYLEISKIREILKRHSQFINYPIYIEVEKEIEVSEEDADEKDEKADDAIVEEEDEASGEEDKSTKKTRKEKVKEDELINDSKPLWLRSASDITDAEYNGFYKVLTKGQEEPVTHIHFNAEGEVEFRSILYAPKNAPFDAYQDYQNKKGTVQLYVRRVLITDEFDELLPNYMGFVRGVVDSDSLPLNVNREMLQQSKVLKVIGKKLVRKAIAMLQSLANKHKKGAEGSDDEKSDETDTDTAADVGVAEDNQDYLTFFKSFGKFLKLGVAEDRSNQARLAKLLRFPSTSNSSGVTSLEKYVERMKDDQKSIYYIAGDNVDALQKHPTIEKLTKKGYEVFLLTDPLDEHCLQSLGEFQGHKIADTSRATLKLDETDDEKKRFKAVEEKYKPLTKWLKDVLGSDVEKVAVSKRLESSLGAVVAGDYGWTANMERIMTSQVFTNLDNMGYMRARKTFEINPNHPVIKQLLAKVAAFQAATADAEDEEQKQPSAEEVATKDTAILLYQTCMLNSGFSLPTDAASEFSGRLERLIRTGLGVSADAVISDVEVEIPEEPEVVLAAEDALEDDLDVPAAAHGHEEL